MARLTAAAAQPVHRQCDSRHRTRALPIRADQLVGDGRGRLADRTAAAADQVDVGGVVGQVVARRPVVEVGVPARPRAAPGPPAPGRPWRPEGSRRRRQPTQPTTSSGVAWPRPATAASTRWRWRVSRLPRARSLSPRSSPPHCKSRSGSAAGPLPACRRDLHWRDARRTCGRGRRAGPRRRTRHSASRAGAADHRAFILVLVLLVVGVAGFVGFLSYTVKHNVTHEALLAENRPR